MDNKKYKAGFRWGKREHKYERITSRLLWIGALFVVGTVAEYFLLHNFYLVIPSLIVFLLAFLIHLIARFSHRREKHHMDKLRRGNRN
jgi:low temperature requirement protein LtrA